MATKSYGLNSSYIPTINALRGLAAVSVCLFHFVNTTTGLFDAEIQEAFKFGKHGVQMFFVISGFVIPYSMINAGYKIDMIMQFIKKRLVRLEPTYLVSILFALSILYLKQFLPGSGVISFPSWTNVILHIGYVIPFVAPEKWINPVYWTLAIEFQYYFLIAILFPLIFSNNRVMRFVVILALCTIGMLIPDAGFIFAHLPCFMFGIAYVLFRDKQISKIEFLLIISISTVSLLYYRGLPDTVTAHLTLLIIIFAPNIKSRITDFFGNISYSLYLVHSILGAAILNFLTHRVQTNTEKWFAVLSTFLVTVAASYLLYVLIEKPSHDYAKKISLRRLKPKPGLDYAVAETKN